MRRYKVTAYKTTTAEIVFLVDAINSDEAWDEAQAKVDNLTGWVVRGGEEIEITEIEEVRK